MGISNYAKNKIQDYVFRAQAWSIPANFYVALIGGAAFPNQGVAMRSKTYAVGNYAWPTVPNGRLYKCTVAGTTGASEPSWPTTDGGTVADGTVTWKEQTPDLANGTIPEVSGNAYARQMLVRSLGTVMGCNLGDSASASSGAGGMVANLAPIVFPTPTAAWGPVWGVAVFDAASTGNPIFHDQFAIPKIVGEGDPVTIPGGTANTAYGGLRAALE